MESIVSERKLNGPYGSVFDFVKRINIRQVNKRCLESLALAGAFDDFPGTHRAQYFYTDPNDSTIFIEKLIRYANQYQSALSSSQQSLFGETSLSVVADPELPECPRWFPFEMLQKEKEVVGFYVSGHPLDQYKIEIQKFVNLRLSLLRDNLPKFENSTPVVAGIISAVNIRKTKDGKEYANFSLEDYSDNYSFSLFSENYLKFKHLLEVGRMVLVKINVTARYNQVDQFEAKIQHIELLDDVLSKYVRKIILFFTLNNINEELSRNLLKWFKENKGACPLEIQIFDNDTRDYLPMSTPKHKVAPDTFLRIIEKNGGIKYRIN